MGRYDQLARGGTAPQALATTNVPAQTYEHGLAATFDARGELFNLAVNLLAGDTFYERGAARDERVRQLTHAIADEPGGPAWLERFVPWLRNDANLRTAPLLVALAYAEAHLAKVELQMNPMAPYPRRVLASAMARADEPAEALAIWQAWHPTRRGSAVIVPKPVKRGIADAAVRLYNEYAALRWDSGEAAWRMGDVIEVTHPKPKAPWQAALFRFLLDRRHGRSDAWTRAAAAFSTADAELTGQLLLPTIATNVALREIPPADRRAWLEQTPNVVDRLRTAAMSWEALSGWLGGPMDRVAWEAVLPSMGYMAQLRNLRNLDEAGVDDATALKLAAKLADPAEVARSKQLPFRFLSAYKAAPSLRWAYPLERALEASLASVPALPGRTLVLLDASPSMYDSVSERSKLELWELAGLFGLTLARAAARGGGVVDVHAYSRTTERFVADPAESLLKALDRYRVRYDARESGRTSMWGGNWSEREIGDGTYTGAALARTYADHDRVVIVTDGQSHDAVRTDATRRSYTFTIGGYRYLGHAGATSRHRIVAGLSDGAFRLIELAEKSGAGEWPF